jgi:hypothetical protein
MIMSQTDYSTNPQCRAPLQRTDVIGQHHRCWAGLSRSSAGI